MKQFFTTRLHVSWLIAVSSIAVFIGVLLAGVAAGRVFASIAWLLTGVALCLFSYVRQRRYAIIIAALGGLLVGMWRGAIEQAALDEYRPLIGKSVVLEGTISEDIDTGKRGDAVLRVKNVRYGNHSLTGALWVTTAKAAGMQRSDRITFEGKLADGFGTFAAAMYDAEIRRIIDTGDVAIGARDWFTRYIRMAVDEPEASLGIGYLVGQRRSLPDELDHALKVAGLTHIVVASGYNLTILVRLARRLFAKISKYTAALASSGLILSFIAITGLSPSMSRAGLIAFLSLAAWYYGRKFHPLVLLSFAVAVTVLFNPNYAWGDVGWQLSFAAFGGVMIMAPLLQAYYFGSKKPGTLRQILGETISATICTLPIILFYFGQMSNVAIIANLLVLPLVPLAMLLTFIAGIGTFVLPALAPAFGFPAHIVLEYMVGVAERLASLPWAVTEIEITSWHVGMMYGLIVCALFYMWYRTRLSLRDSNIIE